MWMRISVDNKIRMLIHLWADFLGDRGPSGV